MKNDYILELARALRPELPKLIVDVSARSRLAQCIIDAELKVITPEELLQKLTNEPVVEQWISIRLDKQVPQHHVEFVDALGYRTLPGYGSLPGKGTGVDADIFVCPEPGCPIIWHRQRVGQKPPLCENHKVLLVLKR